MAKKVRTCKLGQHEIDGYDDGSSVTFAVDEKGNRDLIRVVRSLSMPRGYTDEWNFLPGEDIEELSLSIEDRMIEIPNLTKFIYGPDGAQRERVLYGYGIAKYPVTNKEYSRFVKDTGREWGIFGSINKKKEYGCYPAAGVTWQDAAEYCEWVRKIAKDGKHYRLPTEEEWELAARGTDGRKYPWGNEWKEHLPSFESGITGDGVHSRRMKVGQFSPECDSPYGVADMGFNIREWTSSLYLGSSHGEERGGRYRIVRGGTWYNSKYNRVSSSGGERDNYSDRGPRRMVSHALIGFRLACCWNWYD